MFGRQWPYDRRQSDNEVKVPIRHTCLMVFLGVVAGPLPADCIAVDVAGAPLSFDTAPPEPLDLSLRPVLPACLEGLADPSRENCPREDVARYGAELDAWVAALEDYVTQTNGYANQLAAFANAAVAEAHEARAAADAALDFARCEVDAIGTSGSD